MCVQVCAAVGLNSCSGALCTRVLRSEHMRASVGLGTNGMCSSRFEHMHVPVEVDICELAGRSVNMCMDVLMCASGQTCVCIWMCASVV